MDRNPKSQSPEISEDRRIVADFKDDNYVVGPENKETDFSEFGNWNDKRLGVTANELPGVENPKSRVPKTRRSERPESPENESFENPKIAEPSRARKSCEIERFS